MFFAKKPGRVFVFSRNCHSFETMDFHEQSRRGAKKMQAAMKKGKHASSVRRALLISSAKATKKTTTDVPLTGFHMFVTRKRKSGKLGWHIGTKLKPSG